MNSMRWDAQSDSDDSCRALPKRGVAARAIVKNRQQSRKIVDLTAREPNPDCKPKCVRETSVEREGLDEIESCSRAALNLNRTSGSRLFMI
jgi:hypothetical protein